MLPFDFVVFFWVVLAAHCVVVFLLAVFGRVGVIALSVPGLFLVGLFLDCKTMGNAAVAFILFVLLWVVLAAHCFVFVVCCFWGLGLLHFFRFWSISHGALFVLQNRRKCCLVFFVFVFFMWVVLAANCFVFVLLCFCWGGWGYSTFRFRYFFPWVFCFYCETRGNAAVCFCFVFWCLS
jgi:hypothetical protein